MAVTWYLDVITLDQAKTYLRIDDTQSATDAEITNMIKSALRYVEKQTNHLMYERAIVYNVDETINIYDHPIQSITTPTDADDYTRTNRSTYSTFDMNTTATTITIRSGYALLDDVPNDLIDAALGYMAGLYFSQENNEQFIIPQLVKDLVDANRRFIL